jgi:hypothetical protein
MNIYKLSLPQLFELRGQMISEGLDIDPISNLIQKREKEYVDHIYEDVSGAGGPGGAAAAASIGMGGGGVGYANAATGGMGAVTAAQPSIYAGSTMEPGFSAGGGRTGSGDVSVPYNTGGNKVFQKIAAPDNRKGSNKRRKNKILKGLKNIFSQKQDYTSGEGKVKKQNVMNFNQFSKDQFSKVTKVKQ